MIPIICRFLQALSSVEIWLDDVTCSGSESRLASCSHRGYGVENCAHSEDVALVCASKLASTCKLMFAWWWINNYMTCIIQSKSGHLASTKHFIPPPVILIGFHSPIDSTGRYTLSVGMARALQRTRQMNSQLPPKLQSNTAKNQLHNLLLWSLLSI